MRFLLILILSIPLYSQSSKVLCELNGEYSVTYKDIKKTYLAEGIELFRNLARQTQQSLFLLRRAKTNFAEEDWEKNSLYVVQYWDVDSAEETYKSLTHTLEPVLVYGLEICKFLQQNQHPNIEPHIKNFFPNLLQQN